MDNLTDDDIERIAERAAQRAADIAAKKVLEMVYVEVGKGVLKRLALIIGVVVVALLMWMGGKGIQLPS